ncbi:MAG: eukaryotic-like serine/threonine-protein kinase [Chloroflexota bacterium]|nr:eukaryotic-like serine/threonine-protein kinase [Chloroflexota bacterium]
MPRIGTRLVGRYRLLARIGSGGFATVYRARDVRLVRDVAVKILLPNHVSDPVLAARFDREARALAAVSHPNVVAIHDVGPDASAAGVDPFLVMDLCADGSLADRLAASELGTLPPEELIPILVDVAAGLDALHLRGIVHRDLKPSNILLGDGRARIADLGIALAEPSDLTVPETTVGTLAYLAPEQLAGQPASPASDVHGLAVVAFLGLTGSLPRPAANLAEIVAASRLAPPLLSQVAPALGTAYDQHVAAGLARSPADRPTAAQLGAGLRAALRASRHAPPPRPRAATAAAGAGAAIEGDAPTVRSVAVPARREADRTPRRLIGLVALEALLVVVVGAWVLAALLGPGRAGPGPTGSGPAIPAGTSSPTPAPTPSPTPTPSATPSPTPSPTPTPSPDPMARAISASAAARSAVEDAADHDALKAKEARDLESRLDRFDQAVDDGDAQQARREAERFAGAVDDRLRHDGFPEEDAARLRSAADDLVAAAAALPD